MALTLTEKSKAKQEEQSEETVAERLKRAKPLAQEIREIFLQAVLAEMAKVALEKAPAPEPTTRKEFMAQFKNENRIKEAPLDRDMLRFESKGHLLCRLTKGITTDELRSQGWSASEVSGLMRMRQFFGMNPKTGKLTVSLTALRTVLDRITPQPFH